MDASPPSLSNPQFETKSIELPADIVRAASRRIVAALVIGGVITAIYMLFNFFVWPQDVTWVDWVCDSVTSNTVSFGSITAREAVVRNTINSRMRITNEVIGNTMKTRMATNILLVIFSLLVSVGCSQEKKDRREIIRPVRYQTVSSYSGEQRRTFSGVSKAAVEVELSFKVAGTVRSIEVKVGDKVKKGKVIAEIDKTDFLLKHEQAKAALSNAKVQMQNAKATFERTTALYENNNASLHEFEQAKTAYESAKTAVSSSQRGLQLMASQLNYTRLTAPIDGIVSKVNIETNENLTAGKVVAVINSGSDIEVSVGIPESYISQVKEGESVEVSFPSLPDKTFQGTISEVSFTINSASSTYPVSVALSNPSSEIRPGMAANVILRFASKTDQTTICVPLNTVAEDRAGRFVFTVTENQQGELATVHKKPVKTGKLTSSGIQVIDGLKTGELIVTAGISKLSDGMTVKLLK